MVPPEIWNSSVFSAEELFTLGRKQCRRRVALLMGRADKRDAPGPCANAVGSADARQKAGHITALYRTGLLRHAYGTDLASNRIHRASSFSISGSAAVW